MNDDWTRGGVEQGEEKASERDTARLRKREPAFVLYYMCGIVSRGKLS